MLHTNGWRAYWRLPELGYQHRWVDHSKHYVLPEDRQLHTNGIEGRRGVFKHWLPQAGKYNLEEYMWLFSWIQDKKIRKIDPFWALMALVKADNSIETLKFAPDKADGEATTEAVPLDPKSRMMKRMMKIMMKTMIVRKISLMKRTRSCITFTTASDAR